MKKTKKIFIWIILSLAIQTLVLLYLSNFYLIDDYAVTFTQDKPVASIKNEIKIMIPVNSKNIKLSPTGKYTYYLLNDIPHVINLTDGKDNIVDLSYSIKNYFFKWHDYEDKLIITEKNPSQDSSEIEIYTYSAKENVKSVALDYNNNSRLYKFPTVNVDVSDIQLNTLNTIIYVKASNNNDTSYINRLDISEGMDKVPFENNKIGSFFVLKKSDELVFEDTSNEKIYITNKNIAEEVNISTSNKLKLLKVDKSDNIYIGELENGMIKTIFYKNESDKNWSTKQFDHSVDSNDICVISTDDIYIIDRVKSRVTNTRNDQGIRFEGTFIDMNTNGIISLNNEKILFTKLTNEK